MKTKFRSEPVDFTVSYVVKEKINKKDGISRQISVIQRMMIGKNKGRGMHNTVRNLIRI